MRVCTRLALLVCALSFGVVSPALADELDDLAKQIDDHPEDAKTYDAYATAAFKTKRFDDAIRKLKNGVARLPDYSEGYYKLAYAYRQKKEWADAADYYRRYTVLNPTRTDTYYGLGASLQGLGDKKGAIAAYEKYVSLEKSPAKQRFVEAANAEIVKLDPSRAAIATTPPPPAATPAPITPSPADVAKLRAQAEQLRREGKLEDAAGAYKQALLLDRNNVELHNELGNVYFALRRYSDAAQAFRDATSRDGNFALGWYNLAHALRKADRRSEAVEAYRKYIALKPDDPDPYYGLAQTLKALGDTTAAIEAFKKYISMEKRPEEQKWVDKARAELQALEGAKPHGAAGKVVDDDAGQLWTPEGLLNPFPMLAFYEPRNFDLDSPDPDGLMDPFRPRRELRDFEDGPGVPGPMTQKTRRRLRAYGEAVAAYRRALAQQAEAVSQRYERGLAFALIDDSSAAQRFFDEISVHDHAVDQARKNLERIRQSLGPAQSHARREQR